MIKKPQDLVTVFVPLNKMADVMEIIRENRVQHQPFRRSWDGYFVTVQNGSVATMLKLKYEK